MSKNPKVNGSIKNSAKDFVVQEITQNGTTLLLDKKYTSGDLGFSESIQGKYSLFVLQKESWNTMQALTSIAKHFGRGKKALGFAGTKDRTSVSTQLCSIYGVEASKLMAFEQNGISINGAWQSDEEIKLGSLQGNNFVIKITGAKQGDESLMQKINEGLGGIFPNYYGIQRFGSRGINFNIGMSMLRGDFESSVLLFLTDTSNEINKEAIEARKRLSEERDFSKAMSYFPKYLKYERSMLAYLSDYGPNYTGALRTLPRQLLLMLAHSIESEIFNEEVELCIKEGKISPEIGDIACPQNWLGFPDYQNAKKKIDQDPKAKFKLLNIVGYLTEQATEEENAIMEKYSITKENFKLKQMPEINCKGSFRAAFAPYTGFTQNYAQDNITISFSLPSGSYATVLLNEFIKDV